jgi:hypothetical protein
LNSIIVLFRQTRFQRSYPQVSAKNSLRQNLQTEQRGENKHAAVTILNIGWMHNSMKQQA